MPQADLSGRTKAIARNKQATFQVEAEKKRKDHWKAPKAQGRYSVFREGVGPWSTDDIEKAREIAGRYRERDPGDEVEIIDSTTDEEVS